MKTCGLVAARVGYSCGLAVLILLFASRALQNAVAEGDTRTISLHHVHTNEDLTITYKRDGRYDETALEKINWLLRDWRRSEETQMDPHLIDLVWEVQRETSSTEPIQVVCGYRSPETNAMLRRRSSGVARFSQHMLGKAMDFYIPGVPLEELRVIGLRLQRGGVGFYPTSGSPFVHMDTGGVRMWPRMTREQLVQVFPDGRTVHIPTDGRPLPGYALALADIRKRGADPSENSIEAARNAGIDVGSVASNARAINPFAKLLGLVRDADEDEDDASAAAQPAAAPTVYGKPLVLAKLEHAVSKLEHAASTTAVAARGSVAAAPKLIRAAASAIGTEAAQTTAAIRSETVERFAALSPNQVITTRGYWEGLPDGVTAAQTAATSATAQDSASHVRGTELAAADSVITGSTSPWSGAAEDRVPLELALAYAEQPERDPPLRAAPTTTAESRPAPAPAGHLIAESGLTIATKGLIERPKTAFQTAVQLASTALKARAHFDDPWLRAIVVSPSVRHFLTTLALGGQDFTSLAALIVKPSSSVMMTFSSDPNLGLTPDHFTGSAIVFVSTVTYPTHTASLQ